MKKRVYVAGCYGKTPDVVTTTIEHAMHQCLQIYTASESDFDLPWSCIFIDGDPEMLRCTLTFTASDGEQYALYAEGFEVEESEAV